MTVRHTWPVYEYRVLCKDGHVVYASSSPADYPDRHDELIRRQTARDLAEKYDEWCSRPECKRGPHRIERRLHTDWEALDSPSDLRAVGG